MNRELKKRVFTSFILSIGIVFLIFIDPIIFKISLFLIIFICYLEWSQFNVNYFKKKNKQNPSKYSLVKALGLMYLIFVTFSAYNLRGDTFEDALFLTFIISICASSDIGGYVFGKFIGGKKLTKISPSKTISGSLGSFILSLISVPLFYYFLPEKFNNPYDLIILAIIVSFSCQLGDLFISYLKRKAKVKDTGDLLPGHGGVLDRIDGILFAVPIGILSLLIF